MNPLLFAESNQEEQENMIKELISQHDNELISSEEYIDRDGVILYIKLKKRKNFRKIKEALKRLYSYRDISKITII